MDGVVMISTFSKDEYHEYQKVLYDNLSSVVRKFVKKNPHFAKELFDNSLKERSFFRI